MRKRSAPRPLCARLGHRAAAGRRLPALCIRGRFCCRAMETPACGDLDRLRRDGLLCARSRNSLPPVCSSHEPEVPRHKTAGSGGHTSRVAVAQASAALQAFGVIHAASPGLRPPFRRTLPRAIMARPHGHGCVQFVAQYGPFAVQTLNDRAPDRSRFSNDVRVHGELSRLSSNTCCNRSATPKAVAQRPRYVSSSCPCVKRTS